MEAIKHLPPPPASEALEQLAQSLHRTDRPPTEEERRLIIAATAEDITKHGLPPAIELIERANAYAYVRETLIAKWAELSFATRMMFREMAMSYERNERLWLSMTFEERQALVDAFEREARVRFIFDRRQTMLMARDMRQLVDSDHEVSKAQTSFEVWDEVKRVDPGMEDALFRPLDPSKYVKRDMRRTPRRSA
jgi:hypothetical protein